MTDDIPHRFYERFRGSDRAHGEYILPTEPSDGSPKVSGRGITRHFPVLVELWEKHLAGTYGLGITPIMDGDVCRFGAIDVDVYDLDLPRLAADVHRLGLPLIPCRTKSGGCHLYAFTIEACPAELLRTRLMEWAVVLGYSGCEVFPKQTRLASPRDLGNWINVPYYGATNEGDKSLRYALNKVGEALTTDEFLAYANEKAVSVAKLKKFKMPEGGDELLEGPPCLQALARRGFPQGTRNSALFSLGVYARKRFEDNWKPELEKLNQRLMVPPLSAKEIQDTTKSLAKKDYNYKCSDQPLVGVCNRQLCLTRKFGVAPGGDDPGVVFGDLVKYETDPPTWIMSVNGKNVELSTSQLLDPRAVQQRVVEETNIMMHLVKKIVWDKIVKTKLETVEVEQVPEDIKPEGQWYFYLSEFIAGRAQAKALDELMMGRPWSDDKRSYFRAVDFFEYLKRRHVKFEEKRMYAWFKRIKGQHHAQALKGKHTNYWSVPKISYQTEDYAVPKGEPV